MTLQRRVWIGGIGLLLAASVSLQAAGTITQAYSRAGNIRTVTFTCTADAADGSFPATALTGKFEGRLLAIETNPGSTAPTDNYDVAITDAHGFDVLLGVGANRDTATTERAAVIYASSSLTGVVDETDTLTLAITNSSVNSATIVIVLFYALGG